MQFPQIRGVAFDLDDTLFSRQEAFRSLMKSWIGPESSLEEIIRRDLQGYGDRNAFFNWLAKALFPEVSGRSLENRFTRELPGHIPKQNESIQILNEITARGYPIALLSNGGTTMQNAKLQTSGLLSCFRESPILISEDLGSSKPDLSAFQALEKAMAIPAKHILYLGDHLVNDIEGSQAAGMQSAWMRNDRDLPKNMPPEVFVIDELKDLLPHLPGHE